jgi:hypothetical protein
VNRVPSRAWLETRPFVGGRAHVVHLVRRLAVEGFVRAVLVVPVEDEPKFTLEGRLIFGDRRETHQLFQRSVKPLHDGNTTVLADGPKTRQDVTGCYLPDTRRAQSTRT